MPDVVVQFGGQRVDLGSKLLALKLHALGKTVDPAESPSRRASILVARESTRLARESILVSRESILLSRESIRVPNESMRLPSELSRESMRLPR
ncbi:MAG: hypothetical protein QOH48_2241 [Actinomycetota bacterium]|jgi:hypothetical protein|nr:hypothetical protein [Actinomycetota bacterium]